MANVLHGCRDIHLLKHKRAPQYAADGKIPPDFTLCGVYARYYWWRRKQVKISEKFCPRTVTCKRCAASIRKHKRMKKNK